MLNFGLPFARGAVAIVATTVAFGALDSADAQMLKTVKDRGNLICGVSTGLPGFVLTGASEALLTERAAGTGKVFRVRWDGTGVHKTELADLAQVSDPDGLLIARTAAAAGLARPVSLPASAGSGLIPLGPRRIGLLTERGSSGSFVVLELNQDL